MTPLELPEAAVDADEAPLLVAEVEAAVDAEAADAEDAEDVLVEPEVAELDAPEAPEAPDALPELCEPEHPAATIRASKQTDAATIENNTFLDFIGNPLLSHG